MSVRPVTLSTLHWGRDDGPQVLLLHGITSSAATWWQVASHLVERGASVTAADLRGHGSSPRTTEYALESYAADVLALPRPASGAWDLVVGHSLGGAIAAVTLGVESGWTSATLLVDPPLVIAPDAVDPLVDGMLANLVPTTAEALAAEHPDWHPEDVLQRMRSNALVSRFTVEETIRGNASRAGEWNLESLFAGDGGPVHVLGADPALGALFTAEQGARLAATSRRLTWETVAGAEHSIHRTRSDLVAGRAWEMLERGRA